MILGISVLAGVSLIIFMGWARDVTRYFGNDFLAMVLILATIILNIIRPLVIERVDVYIGSAFLLMTMIAFITARLRGKNLAVTLIAGLALIGVYYGYATMIIDQLAFGMVARYLLIIIFVALLAFIIGRDMLSISVLAIVPYYVADTFRGAVHILSGASARMEMGGGEAFGIMISAQILAILLSLAATKFSSRYAGVVRDGSPYAEIAKDMTDDVEKNSQDNVDKKTKNKKKIN